MVRLLTSLVAVMAAAPMALAAVADICAQRPYSEIQRFKGHAHAIEYCHAHYPQQVIHKTAHASCLTTTSTAIEGRTTVTVSRTRRCSTTESASSYPESVNPVPSSYPKRDAAAAPAPNAAPAPTTGPNLRRDGPPAYGGGPPGGYGNAPKANEWDNYYSRLLQCGYDCVQSACSCFQHTRTVYTTPKPTCTSTVKTSTYITVTSTEVITPEGYSCEHDGHKIAEMAGQHDGHRIEQLKEEGEWPRES